MVMVKNSKEILDKIKIINHTEGDGEPANVGEKIHVNITGYDEDGMREFIYTNEVGCPRIEER